MHVNNAHKTLTTWFEHLDYAILCQCIACVLAAQYPFAKPEQRTSENVIVYSLSCAAVHCNDCVLLLLHEAVANYALRWHRCNSDLCWWLQAATIICFSCIEYLCEQ
jgi:hypothetical protein